MIYVENKKKKEATLLKKYPEAIIADVTSKATTGLVKLSPFYPHGDIPVPFSEGYTSECVEGIWQGLKVFEGADIDISLFKNDTMKDIKRTVRKYGKPLGHRKGVHGKELLNYLEARFQIYLPSYKWILENKVKDIINKLAEASKDKDIVLLDYETNCDVFNTRKPLSHAGLIKAYVEKNFPEESSLDNFKINSIVNTANEPTIKLKKKRTSQKTKKKVKSVSNAVQTKLF
jgi:hypothetical protein